MSKQKLDPRVTFGWATGKSIEDPTADKFRAANIEPKFANTRSCIGVFRGLPGFEHCLRLKAQVVGEQVAGGAIAAGITGLDLLIEAGLRDRVHVVATLAYSKVTNGGTRGTLVGRQGGPTLEDLRRNPGKYRIACEYYEAAKQWLAEQGIQAEVVHYPGGVESLVAAGLYDFCVVLVETGTSLRQNYLVELATIFESQTVLIANKALYADPEVKKYVDFLARLLLGAIEARDKRYLVMNVEAASLDKVLAILPSLSSPTVQPLSKGGYAVSSVVPLEGLAALKLRLLEAGATGIVELDAHSII